MGKWHLWFHKSSDPNRKAGGNRLAAWYHEHNPTALTATPATTTEVTA